MYCQVKVKLSLLDSPIILYLCKLLSDLTWITSIAEIRSHYTFSVQGHVISILGFLSFAMSVAITNAEVIMAIAVRGGILMK